MFAEDTSEVVDVAFDDFQRTAAVLLLQTWLAIDVGHSGVVQIDGVETDPAITGGFSQRYLLLRENSEETTPAVGHLGVSPCIPPTSCRIYSYHSPGPCTPRTPGNARTSVAKISKLEPKQTSLPSDCSPSS